MSETDRIALLKQCIVRFERLLAEWAEDEMARVMRRNSPPRVRS